MIRYRAISLVITLGISLAVVLVSSASSAQTLRNDAGEQLFTLSNEKDIELSTLIDLIADITGKNFNEFTCIEIDSGNGFEEVDTTLVTESPDLGEDGEVCATFAPNGQQSIKVRIKQKLLGGSIYSEEETVNVVP